MVWYVGRGVVKIFENENWTSYTINNMVLVNNYVTAMLSMVREINGLDFLVECLNLMVQIGQTIILANGLKYNLYHCYAIDSRGNIWVAPSTIIVYPPYEHIGVMEFDGKNGHITIQRKIMILSCPLQ